MTLECADDLLLETHANALIADKVVDVAGCLYACPHVTRGAGR